MESFIKYGIGLVAVVALVLGFVAYNRQTPVSPPFGAAAGPDFNSNGAGFSFDGAREFDTQVGMIVASTTDCIIKSPAATSSLVFASAKYNVATGTATVITFGKGTVFATTTLLGSQVTIASGAQAFIVASSTTLNYTSNDFVFAPNSYLVVGQQGGASGTNFNVTANSNTCQARFYTN